MPTEDKISGYDFVQRIMKWHPDDLVEALLELSHNGETDYLEFKAGIEVPECDLNSGEKPEDIYWVIAKAIIAMVNTRGGILFLGVSDDKDHHVVPLESNDPKNIIAEQGPEAYVRMMVAPHVFPRNNRWSYKELTISTEDDISQYVEERFFNYMGTEIIGFLVKPCAQHDYIIIRKYKDGKPFDFESCPYRKKGNHGECAEKVGIKAILKYAANREIASANLAIDANHHEEKCKKQQKIFDEDMTKLLKGRALLEQIQKMIKNSLDSKVDEGVSDVSSSQKAHMYSPIDHSTDISKGVESKMRMPAFTLAELNDLKTRTQIEKKLSKNLFDAVCIKSLGTLGFLEHPDFENGIVIHISATNNKLLSEGQKWRVTVGTRFNEKHGAWCYYAQSATLIEEAKQVSYPFSLLAEEKSRRQTVDNLRGIFYEARCIIGHGNYGYLTHPDFEGEIYIDVPVTNGIKILEGQKWKFEVGAHCLPPEGLWIYRARNATLVEDAPKYTLEAIAEQESRIKTLGMLKGQIFKADCTEGRGTCGLLSHSEFEGEIYIDVPVTNHVAIHTGQTWQFEIGVHRMGPSGPWVYRAKKASLVSGKELPFRKNGESAKDYVKNVQPPTQETSATVRFFSLKEINDENQRSATMDELSNLQIEAVCIKSFGTFGFLNNSCFEGNIFIHKSTAKEYPIVVGQRWSIQVGVLFNGKRGLWCYCATSGIPKETHASNGTTSDANSQVKENEEEMPPTVPPADQFSIYIDETWPGAQNPLKKDIGVIAGIVWMGPQPDYKALPFISTHLQDKGGYALKNLLNCKKAFPFAFPIRLPNMFDPNPEKYLQLLSDALVLLLGWILPQPAKPTNVVIHAEHFGNFKDGTDGTNYFKALFTGTGMTLNTNRFSMWTLQKVEWQGKEFGYIPYGDLVAYLFAETPYAQQMARDFQVDKWPGCVPFSPKVLPALRDLDVADPDGSAGALFRLSELCDKSQLFKHSLRMVLDSAKQRPELRDAILARLCDEYEKKDRNLRTIGRIADVFFAVFPDQTFADKPKLRFLRMLASLQKANHDGNPAAAEQILSSYGALHSEMEKRDLELCVYADLNVAVHFNDRFEFDKAEKLLRQCQESPSFLYLSAHNRGRLLSSLGQSAVLQGRYAEADARFSEALGVFSEVGGELEEETDQTRIYRAFAALDTRAPNMRSLLEEALTISLDKAVSRPEAIACYPYREHLLAKALWLLKQSGAKASLDLIENYVATNEQWGTERQHPWELTLLYRGLLAFEINPAISAQCFDALEEWFRSVPHGDVLDLIHAFCLIAEHLHCERKLDKGSLESLLAQVKEALPATVPTAEALFAIAKNNFPESVANLWSLMPFNYK